jgi:non-specific serine/threonine protein kinase
MAVSAAILHEELPQNKPRMFGRIPRYPKRMAKQVLLHTLKGLVFLHTNGVVHGDLQPGNILFSLQNIATIDTCELVQDDSSAVSVQRLDGKTDKWAPTKLYPSQPLHDRVGLGADLCVKVADLGGGELSSVRT